MEAQETQEKLFTTIPEVVKTSGLTYKQIYNDVKSGILPSMKKGKYYYIPVRDASRYMYDLICQARGIDDKFKEAYNKAIDQFAEELKKNNDKSKN